MLSRQALHVFSLLVHAIGWMSWRMSVGPAWWRMLVQSLAAWLPSQGFSVKEHIPEPGGKHKKDLSGSIIQSLQVFSPSCLPSKVSYKGGLHFHFQSEEGSTSIRQFTACGNCPLRHCLMPDNNHNCCKSFYCSNLFLNFKKSFKGIGKSAKQKRSLLFG